MLRHIRQTLAMIFTRAVLGVLQGLGVAWGHTMFVAGSNSVRITRLNLSLAFPHLGSRRLRRLTYLSMLESGKLFFEMILFWTWPAGVFTRATTKVDGEDLIHRAREAGRGVVVITPHLGNWEIFNIPFARYSMAGLYKQVASPRLDRWVRFGRERYGGRLIPLTPGGLRDLRRHLNDRGLVVALPDQVPGREAGRVQVPFFGVPAWTGTLMPRLIPRCNVTVLMACARRLPRARGFRVELEPAPEAVYSDDPQCAARAINAGMEKMIRRCPEQYLWEYKRFKQTIYPGLYDRPRPYRHRR